MTAAFPISAPESGQTQLTGGLTSVESDCETGAIECEIAWLFTGDGSAGPTSSINARTVEANLGTVGSEDRTTLRGIEFLVHGEPPIREGGVEHRPGSQRKYLPSSG